MPRSTRCGIQGFECTQPRLPGSLEVVACSLHFSVHEVGVTADHECVGVVRALREKRFGRIVNFAAVGAEATLGEPQMAAYSAAKAGVVAFSKALALEEARCGITVNVVSPGLLRDETGNKDAKAADEMLGDRVPVGHAGRSADVVRAVLFFVTPAAEFVTGQVLEVAGGARQ